MLINLFLSVQTLSGAWESGDLKEKYFTTWLTNTSCELVRLERTAAPSGWDCQWDRYSILYKELLKSAINVTVYLINLFQCFFVCTRNHPEYSTFLGKHSTLSARCNFYSCKEFCSIFVLLFCHNNSVQL